MRLTSRNKNKFHQIMLVSRYPGESLKHDQTPTLFGSNSPPEQRRVFKPISKCRERRPAAALLVGKSYYSKDKSLALCWDFSHDFTQCTATYCTRSAHGGFYAIDFIGLFLLSIMGATANSFPFAADG
jgi:hypothetical protein